VKILKTILIGAFAVSVCFAQGITVKDADGNVYKTVKIGKQVWMAENLRVTKYKDGSPIEFDTSTTTWNNAKTPRYCYYNNTTNADSIKKYGALYNWYVVSPANPKKIAPPGWHVPSDSEWRTSANTGAAGNDLTINNQSGFLGLPGGFRSNNGVFNNVGRYGYWWSATENDASSSWERYLNWGSSTNLGRSINFKSAGFSVRLVRD